MYKSVLFVLLFALFIVSCEKNKTTEISNQQNVDKSSTLLISPDKNPRKALESVGFWNKQYFSLEYNPLYGYCYQHLFPDMDTSQEKDVIAFHIPSLDDPMVIFVLDKVAYNNGQYELSGKINDKPTVLYVKVFDDKTLNVMLADYEINDSFDLTSGIAYSSFVNTRYKNQDEPVFDLTAYDTCEELDKKIIADISDKLTDETVSEQHGIDVKTDNGYDCWGKWTSIDDMKNVYYELNKEKMEFLDYTELLYAADTNEKAKVHISKIRDMAYKNGIFYFNFEDNELIGYMCLPVDDNLSMWVLDDINLGLFEKMQ